MQSSDLTDGTAVGHYRRRIPADFAGRSALTTAKLIDSQLWPSPRPPRLPRHPPGLRPARPANRRTAASTLPCCSRACLGWRWPRMTAEPSYM